MKGVWSAGWVSLKKWLMFSNQQLKNRKNDCSAMREREQQENQKTEK